MEITVVVSYSDILDKCELEVQYSRAFTSFCNLMVLENSV